MEVESKMELRRKQDGNRMEIQWKCRNTMEGSGPNQPPYCPVCAYHELV